MRRLAAALTYAKQGYRVFPLHSVGSDGRCTCGSAGCTSPAKHPRTKSGVRDATTDEARIREWWSSATNANVGIATGSGIGVLDIDPRHDGDVSLAHLEQQFGAIETFEVQTGGRGRHLYLRVPEGTRSRKIADGIDFKADGGYVVAPPSVHASGGTYVVVRDGDPTPAPPWVLDDTVAQNNGRVRAVPDRIQEGERNEVLASVGGSLRRRGIEQQEIASALHVINDGRCYPPLEHDEVEKIAASVSRYEPQDRTYKYTDYGNAERLVDAHGRDLLYVPGRGWYTWDGRRFRRDEDGATERLMKRTVRAMYDEAAQMSEPDERERLVKHALKSEAAPRIRMSISLAQSEIAVVLHAAELDADPLLLNVENGTLDLRTGELREHRREDRLTKIASTVYVADAVSPLWHEFLNRAFQGDEELIAFVQRAVGYSLTGSTEEEVLFFPHGPTATGKSTFIEAVKAVMGDYAATADFETFLRKHGDAGIRPDIARLAGARLVVSIEVEEGKRLAEGLVKQLTGGDTVTARHLYREAFEFKPQFTLWLVANARPHVRADDAAMWRRIVQVPFVEVIPEAERDHDLKRRLKHDPEVQSAILAWAVEGCREWQEKGLLVPDRVRDYTEEYRQENDPFGQWFDDCCALEADAFTTSPDLRQSYEAWAHEVGAKVHGPKALTRALKERGCTQAKDRKDRRGWSGVKVTNLVRVKDKGWEK